MSDPSFPESAKAVTRTSKPKPHPRLTRRPITPNELGQRRAAAKKSTGPRTPAGKARVSMNALKHGPSGDASFFWDPMCALGEDPHEFKNAEDAARLRPASRRDRR